MAIIIDATPGGANSNSYITEADAVSYFEGRLHSAAWDDATDENRKSALVMATRTIDQTFAFQGYKTDSDQALSFPRTGVVNCEGETLASDVIPKAIEDATCEQALAFLGFDLTKKPAALFQGVSKAEVKNGVMAEFSLAFQPDTLDKMTIISVGCLGKVKGSGCGGLSRY